MTFELAATSNHEAGGLKPPVLRNQIATWGRRNTGITRKGKGAGMATKKQKGAKGELNSEDGKRRGIWLELAERNLANELTSCLTAGLAGE